MSITYEEALATLTSMFAAPWTEDSLDTVLRHFEGHMENTVDAVLSHGDADPAELVERLEASQAGTTMEDMDAALARQLSNVDERLQTNTNENAGGMATRDSNTYQPQSTASSSQSSGQNPAAAAMQKGRGTATALPPDFLRIPGSPAQISNDEALARMLQDKLFAEELRNNPEFAHLARGRGSGRGGIAPGVGYPGSGPRRAQGAGQPPEVLKALQGMGEQAKRRFQDLAQKFKNRMDQSQNQPDHAGYNQIGAAERRGLLDIHEDEDEQEISFVGNGGANSSRNTNYEMKSMDNGFAIGGKKQD